jgi:DNA-binding Xre family transcriptional regulator
MRMRLRIPELLEKHAMTPYALSKRSGGRVSLSTAYRLNRSRGKVATFDGELLEALCDVFGVGPGEVLEREKKRSRAK